MEENGVCPKQFLSVLDHTKEHYIAHVKLEKDTMTMLLTNLRVFCYNDQQMLMWMLPYLSIYSIEINPVQEGQESDTQFHLTFVNPKKSVKSPLVTHSFLASTKLQKELWVIVLRRLLRDAWQQFFEGKQLLHQSFFFFQ
jgi:hypothetical protein